MTAVRKKRAKKTARTRIDLRMDNELLSELDAWRANQRVPVTRTAVIEAAVRAFIEEQHG